MLIGSGSNLHVDGELFPLALVETTAAIAPACLMEKSALDSVTRI